MLDGLLVSCVSPPVHGVAMSGCEALASCLALGCSQEILAVFTHSLGAQGWKRRLHCAAEALKD